MNEVNPDIEILSEYYNSQIRVKCKCKIDGYEWEALPPNLLTGKGCKKCSEERMRQARRKSHEQFISEMEIINKDIKILENYDGDAKKIKCKCYLHNEIFFITPHHLLEGKTSCKKCISLKNHQSGLKTHEQFVQDLLNVNLDINVIGEYNGATKRIKVQCSNGHVWEPIASSLLCGYGCPYCKSSKGEEKIKKYLDDNNISFKRQKTFSDLKGIGGYPLSYDFYLPDYNLLIEYQGEFHDGTAKIQTPEGLERQQKNDLRKKNYAMINNINFLEIWYYNFNCLENILQNYINNLKNPVTTTAV